MRAKEDFWIVGLLGASFIMLIAMSGALVVALDVGPEPAKLAGTSTVATVQSAPVPVEIVPVLLTQEQATAIATQRVNGVVKEAELDKHNGEQAWEIEIKSLGKTFEVVVHASTGQILLVEEDEEEITPPKKSIRITELQARSIAKNEFNGIVQEVEFERYKGKDAYAVEFEDGRYEVEVMVDIATGDVLGVERELDD